MQLNRVLEQHIAVFGESGSGKTVLLSSFYGAAQEKKFADSSPFHVVADDLGQGRKLHANYLGMRKEARTPEANRFRATSYPISLKLKDSSDPSAMKARQFDALRLVWHDYPGEWFEQEPSGPEEAQRRVDTFRSLLTSDVALLLVDGQQLLDNAGVEERYLKPLLMTFHNVLLTLKDQLLTDGKLLVDVPRIWMMALSKSDLLPDMDVYTFRDLLIVKAGDEMEQLRKLLSSLMEAGDALSVGDDFVLLSSAKFEPDRIVVTERVGLNLIVPMAAMLPFERHVRWAQTKTAQGKVAESLLGGVGPIATALIGGAKALPGPLGFVVKLLGSGVIDNAAQLVGDKLRKFNAAATAKQDLLAATLSGFRMDLDKGEEEQILLRSPR